MSNEKQETLARTITEFDNFIKSIQPQIDNFKEIFPHLRDGIKDGLDIDPNGFKKFVESDLFWESLVFLKDNSSFNKAIKRLHKNELIKQIPIRKKFEGINKLGDFAVTTYDAPWPLYMYITQIDIGFLHSPETPREFWKDYEKRLKDSLVKHEILNNDKKPDFLGNKIEFAREVISFSYDNKISTLKYATELYLNDNLWHGIKLDHKKFYNTVKKTHSQEKS